MTKTHPLTGRVQRDPEPQYYYLTSGEKDFLHDDMQDRRFAVVGDWSPQEARLIAELSDPLRGAIVNPSIVIDPKRPADPVFSTLPPGLFYQQFGRALRPSKPYRPVIGKLIRSGHLPRFPSARDLRMVSWRRPL